MSKRGMSKGGNGFFNCKFNFNDGEGLCDFMTTIGPENTFEGCDFSVGNDSCEKPDSQKKEGLLQRAGILLAIIQVLQGLFWK